MGEVVGQGDVAGPVMPVGSRLGAWRLRLLACGFAAALLAACAGKGSVSWDSLRTELVEQGLSEDDAQCTVNRLQVGDREVLELDDRGSSALFLEALVHCQGAVPGSIVSCMLEEAGPLFGGADASIRELAAAESSFDAADREAFAEASLRCQGATEEVAACVTEAMRREFGEDVFEARRLDLSPEEARRREALTAECAGADVDPTAPGVAVEAADCDSYARAIAAAWEEFGVPAEGTPQVVEAIADTLEATVADAPPALRDDMAALSATVGRHADEFAAASSEERDQTLEATLVAMAGTDLQQQVGVWKACPDLDAHLAAEPNALTTVLFAIGGSQADLEDELLVCLSDPDAAAPGDNAGCDALVRACEDNEFDACDDLYVWSQLGSQYEEIGATCGAAVAPENDLYAQATCDVLAG